MGEAGSSRDTMSRPDPRVGDGLSVSAAVGCGSGRPAAQPLVHLATPGDPSWGDGPLSLVINVTSRGQSWRPS
jgi:hypothetical protein